MGEIEGEGERKRRERLCECAQHESLERYMLHMGTKT